MQLAEHGGGAGIRDVNLLESALACPVNLAADGDCVLTMLAVAAGDISEEEFASWLRAHTVTRV